MQKLLNKGSTARKFFSTLVMTSLVVPGILLQVPEAKALGTLATTVISNQATAVYKDAGGNSYTSTSNLVTTTISQIYGVSLIPDSTGSPATDAAAQATPGQSQNATPGTIVYYPYTLTNTGNGADTFRITTTVGADATNGTTGGAAGAIATAINANKKVFLDVNGNGIIDVGDTQIANNAATPSVPADGTIKLVVQYQIPVTAAATNVALVDIQAESVGDGVAAPAAGSAPSTGFDSYNYNKTIVVTSGVVNIVKSVDKAAADPSITGTPSDLTYSFNIANTGNQPADNIVLIDKIPTNTSFVVGSAVSGTGTFTYYTSVDGTGTAVTPVSTGGIDATIKSIKYVLGDTIANNGNELQPANNRTISFQVRVNSGAPSVAIPNFGTFTYEPDTTIATDTSPAPTNTVNTNINKKAAALISFGADGSRFQTPIGAANEQTKTGTDAGSVTPGTPDDTTVEDTAAAGSYVYYKNLVTNNGNAADTFNITELSNTFPSGSTVSFLALTDPTTPTNNTTALQDTNTDGLIDTGSIAAGASLTIVTRVFVPTTATVGGIVTVNAASTNGGTAFGTAPGQKLFDTTRNTLTAVTQPSVTLANIINATPTDNTAQTFTETALGASVSYPLNVKNNGSSSDTFNLTASLPGTLPGSTVTFYPINVSTKVGATAGAIGDNSLQLATVTGVSIGDKLVINGQTLTINAINSGTNTVTFASGQTLAAAAPSNTTAVVPGTLAITSTNIIAPTLGQDVLAVVSIPPTTTPASNSITFRAVSTNNGSVNDTEPDTLIVPSFKNFSLVNNRTGSAPAGGVLFYDHTVTNNGNVNESFTLSIPADVVGGMSYQLIDTSGNPSALSISTGSIVPGASYTFKLKVTVPAGLPVTTVDSKVITAHENSYGAVTTFDQTNTDSTTVVSGFISLLKSVLVYPVGTGATGGTGVAQATAKPGEVLEYTINYTNISSQSAFLSTIIDAIPANTTYVPGSLFIGATAASDTKQTGVGSDAADYNVSSTGAVTFNIGTNAQGDLGGTVTPSATGFVKFRVKIN